MAGKELTPRGQQTTCPGSARAAQPACAKGSGTWEEIGCNPASWEGAGGSENDESPTLLCR